jgi:hypothetical protein
MTTDLNESLRPSTLGEILDRTAQIYRGNFRLFAGTAIIPVGILVGIGALGGGLLVAAGITSGGGLGANLALGAVVVIAALLAVPTYIAAAVYSAAALTQAAVSAFHGEKLTIRAALRSVRPRFWSYFGLLLLQGVIAAALPGIAAGGLIVGLIYLGTRAGSGTAGAIAIGFVIFLVAASAAGIIFWLALSYSMGLAVCVAEQKPAWDSLQRAFHLSRGTRGRIFVMFLLVIALSMIASTVSYLAFTIVALVAASIGHGAQYATVAAVAGAVLQAIVSLGAQIVLQPVSWIALVLFYYDQRIRGEGYDIERLMERAGMTQPPPAPFQITSAQSIMSAEAAPETISAPAPRTHTLPTDTVEDR